MLIITLLFMRVVVVANVYQYKTYYYELKASINQEGIRTPESGDGQFYTFTQQSCYESDIDGNTEGLGSAKFIQHVNNIYVYRGSGFYGEADYCVTNDYEILNIQTKAGFIYILQRKTHPTGFMASKHKEIKKKVGAIVNSYQVPYSPSTTIQSSGTTNSNTSPSTIEYYDCPSCYGTGKCPICHGRGVRSSYYTENDLICTSCLRGECSACNGTGKKTRIKR